MKAGEQHYRILNRVDSPRDIKSLSIQELELLAREIRDKIIETVSHTGGHLAPSLGAVEIAIALHYVFDAPNDKIIWDVGHQAYAHKLLTGRRDRFHTLRTLGGLSGFPKRAESPYDSFDTGHSSTSISAGLGISTAKALKGEDHKVIAVIGDGSMTAGMAFEGLNQAGETEKDLIVVLNDNGMSIAPNVGSFSSFLSRKMTGKRFVNLRREIDNFFRSLPGLGENIISLLRKSEDSLITFFTPGMLFEAFKFKYIGPIQGHRLDMLIETFENVRRIGGPILVHAVTVKGKGYEPAEINPCHFHSVGSFDVPTGCAPSPVKPKPLTYTEIFGSTMLELAASNEKLFAITAAMPEGTGLAEFGNKYPERFLDVGIAEQHAVTFAAGLACEGFRPVVAIYSTFLQRSFDQIIHDVCLPKLPVVFALDRAGIVGEDGPTHHGQFDITYLRSLPNMTVMAPKDENELRKMLFTALSHDGPVAIRYPRGPGLGVEIDRELEAVPFGRAEILKEGSDIVIVALGSMVTKAIEASGILGEKGISAAVINARFVKPLDLTILHLAAKAGRMIIAEENTRLGGLGSAVMESLSDEGIYSVKIARVALPDAFIEHGPQEVLREKYGVGTASIVKAAEGLMAHEA
ncbi:MAG: 1-deoxy-D-xylulose-5-phosphate synthase [Deltaproteobacteria bacterium CG_4_8_14_3_um_filter_51_11]|nr:1-deoxy-D-xylulose-5-phosphate synthase [bacterium]PIP48259.1 MAG: 1-deoxy-D-xylulose-5-phosphate synthase [Deltaproteobacteria bacterium CG23_combo_of_CG06-09_8_20_14_all_51_20]PIX20432.1 MAG: 1-deoxy-D-xylulose-5-phosphate synthase [Deltaproteobacteria bacterium CG_4_8_14_3_um_filter_51_11]